MQAFECSVISGSLMPDEYQGYEGYEYQPQQCAVGQFPDTLHADNLVASHRMF